MGIPSPLAGSCRPVCTNCYAMRMAATAAGHGHAESMLVPPASPDAAMSGRAESTSIAKRSRHRSAGASRSASLSTRCPNLFQEEVDENFIQQVWRVMECAHWHSFQVLTKRPERMLQLLSRREYALLSNVWLGTSVESEDYLGRIDILRRVPARIRFPSRSNPCLARSSSRTLPIFIGRSWVVSSARRACPMEPRWVDELRNACRFDRGSHSSSSSGAASEKNRTGRLLHGRPNGRNIR